LSANRHHPSAFAAAGQVAWLQIDPDMELTVVAEVYE
jgi:hypothetical protein